MEETVDLQEQLARCEERLQQNPALAFVYYDKGVLLRNLKRYEEALMAFEQAIQLDPDLVLAYSGKGVALIDLKKYKDALLAFDQVLRLDPTYVRAYINKGNTYTLLKQYNKAFDAYEKAYQLDPTDNRMSERMTKLKRYNQGSSLRRISRITMELWRIRYAIYLVAVGLTIALLSLNANKVFALTIALFTIAAALVVLFKTFR